MSCEDFQSRWLAEDDADGTVAAHVATCASCQSFIADARSLLADAAMPEPTQAEHAALQPLAAGAVKQWQRSQHQKSWLRQGIGLAVAASFGAIIASAALLPRTSGTQVAPVAPVTTTFTAEPTWALGDLAVVSDSLDVADDELDFEVSWPTVDGEMP